MKLRISLDSASAQSFHLTKFILVLLPKAGFDDALLLVLKAFRTGSGGHDAQALLSSVELMLPLAL